MLLISLLPSVAALAAGLDVTRPGDQIRGVPNDGDWPGNEAPRYAIDDNIATKYLHFKGDFDPDPGTGGAGFRVTPSTRQTVVVGLTLTTANDVPGRDPIAFELSGSNGSISGPYRLIARGEIVDFNLYYEWPRFTKNQTPISFSNNVAYDHYQLIFTAIRGPAGGMVDSMQIAEVELLGVGLIASNPSPSDGTSHPDTWVTLRWVPSQSADSHDVYFGESFADVEAGVRGTFMGNQTSMYFNVGLPGSPYSEGLSPGTTYYWRIDEIESDGRTKHKGNVWSFTTLSLTAFAPYPPDGSKFVDLDVTLSWTPGFGDLSHNVYFGEDFNDVSEGIGDTFRSNQVSASFDLGVLYPDGLIPSKTYYWRIDEVELAGGTIHEGDVWSFTAAIPGLGTIIQEIWYDVYSESLEALKNHWKYPDQPDETTVLTRFETGNNLGENYGGRIHGWLYVPLTGNYTFWICTDDQGELWLSPDDDPRNVELIAYVKDSPTAATGWANRDLWIKYASQKSNPIRLTAGDKYYIMALWKEGFVDDHCQVAWEGPGIPERTIIPGCYLSAEPVGTYPQPADGAKIGNKTPVLYWNPREAGVVYDVYLGTNYYLVNNASRWDQSGIYRGRWSIASYTAEELVVGRTYYWRIDEVEANGWTISKGSVWSFTIVDVDTVECRVSSSEDDGYASNDSLQNLSADYLRAGLSSFSGPPYYMSGMVFRNVNIPQGTEIISARLKIYSHDNRLDGIVYGKVEAEAADDAESLGGPRHVGSLPRTGASVDWDQYEPWEANTWYESPDIAEVIQEVIDRVGWSSNNSLTILYSTRDNEGGYRNFSSYDRGGDLAPKLEITYVPR